MYHQVKRTYWILIKVFCLQCPAGKYFVCCGKQNFAKPPLCIVRTLIHENNLVGRLAMRSTRWRAEFQENLARKDAEEKTKMEELKAKAKKELEDW